MSTTLVINLPSGLCRISVGGALARTAWTGVLAAARENATHGTFHRFAPTASHTELSTLCDDWRATGRQSSLGGDAGPIDVVGAKTARVLSPRAVIRSFPAPLSR